MLLFPLLFPVNMDMVFVQFGLFFYAYGVYLHWCAHKHTDAQADAWTHGRSDARTHANP